MMEAATLRARLSAAALLVAALALSPLAQPNVEHGATGVGSPKTQGLRRFALVAGSNDGGKLRTKLLYASSDASAFADVISELGGVSGQDLTILRDPGRAAFLKGLEDMRRKISEAVRTSDQVELLVYFSGHSDERGFLLGEDQVTYDEFRKYMDIMPARVRLAIVDACASGALTRQKGGRRLPALNVDQSSNLSGYAFLTSSSGVESAQESDRIQASYFTHFLVTGLRGAADLNQDGKVTLAEAYQFAFNETLAETEGSQAGAQHPGYDMRLTGSGDLVLTDLRGTSAGLVLPEEMRGRLFVRSARGDLVAELQKHGGRKVELGLEPGRYELALDKGDALFRSSVTVDAEAQNTVAESDMRLVAREKTRERGSSGAEAANAGGEAADVSESDRNVNDTVAQTSPEAGAPAGMAYYYRLPMKFMLGMARSVQNSQSSLLINRVESQDGLQLALGLNMSFADAHGLQLAMLANDVAGTHRGVQAAAGVNLITADIDGLQFALIGNLVGASVSGGQIGLLLNLAGGRVRGLQTAGGLNLAEGSVDFGQAALGMNWCGGEVRGAQVAGVSNAAEGLIGLQAGVVNTVGRGIGWQAGVVNIAGRLTGAQTGIVNVAREMHGASLGLINVIGNGVHNAEITYDEKSLAHAALVLGGPYNYMLYSLDAKGNDPGGLWGFSGGLGGHLPVGPAFADADVTSGLLYGDSKWKNWSLDSRGRLMAGWRPFAHFALVAGVSYNVENWDASRASNLNSGDAGEDWGDGWRASSWTGYFIGVRL